jgi:hypothetical protein
MARVTLQVKNVASLVLAAGASAAFGFASRRFDNPAKPRLPAATLGVLLLSAQLALIFVESREEEELSLFRRHRMAGLRQQIEEEEAISEQIQAHTKAGNIEVVEKWAALRRRKHGR